MDFTILFQYGPLLLSGLVTTLALAFLSFGLAVLMGAVGCYARLSRNRIARGVGNIYTIICRGIPDLVMIFLVFYGGQVVMNWLSDHFNLGGINVSAFWAGVITLGFYNGAFLVETFRAAYLAIPKGQVEAAKTLGLDRLTILRQIILTPMVVAALSGVNNVWQVLVKSTALVSVIGLYDLVGYADKAGKATKQPFVFFVAVVIFYFSLTIFSSSFFNYLERRTFKFRRRYQ
ncbi:MAG: ABC transporter permease subunit [Hydrotalea sp.]|nr:ABC transporter permease subunit [Hydrotalea sp.]